MPYEVYLYTLPRVTVDNKSIPGPESERREFDGVDEARSFAAESKDKFDRVVLMQNGEEGQKLVERYTDGKAA